jgi:hypothetical protein
VALRRLRPIAALVLLAAGAGPAPAQTAVSCQSSHKPAAVAELMFGRKIGGRIAVSEARWMRFVDTEITPRFPAGLSILDVRGQWRDPKTGAIVREPSKIVMIVLPGEDADHQRLDAIIEAYKTRFRQQSVGLMIRPACVLF